VPSACPAGLGRRTESPSSTENRSRGSLTKGPSEAAGHGACAGQPAVVLISAIAPVSAAATRQSWPRHDAAKVVADQVRGEGQANQELPRWADEYRDRAPPSAGMTIGDCTNRHLSPGRGIWCVTQLNTKMTHDIPLAVSGLARTSVTSLNPDGCEARCTHAGTLAPPAVVARRNLERARAEQTWGLTSHPLPVSPPVQS
jgi:hypothetical protein